MVKKGIKVLTILGLMSFALAACSSNQSASVSQHSGKAKTEKIAKKKAKQKAKKAAKKASVKKAKAKKLALAKEASEKLANEKEAKAKASSQSVADETASKRSATKASITPTTPKAPSVSTPKNNNVTPKPAPKPVETSKVLGVSYISQYAAGAPNGCEAASGLQALHYKGYASQYDLGAFLKTMPIAENGNPYQGFGGTPYDVVGGVYQSIFPSAFVPWLNRFGKTSNLSGQSVDSLIAQVKAGNPVVVWVINNYVAPQWHQYNWGQGIDNAHVVTLDGYNSSSLHIVDPVSGGYWVSKAAFTTAYNYMKFAVAVQ